MRRITKKQKEYLAGIPLLSNDVLMEEFIGILPGDDYDGCLTSYGELLLDASRKELYGRLKKAGFLSEGFGDE